MENLIAAAAVVLPVTLISAAIGFFRVGALAHPSRLQAYGLRKSGVRTALRFMLTAFLLGYAAAGMYGWLVDFQPSDALPLMLWAGFIVTAALSLSAAFVRPRLGLGGLAEIVVLALLWGGAYGWLLPEVVRTYGAG